MYTLVYILHVTIYIFQQQMSNHDYFYIVLKVRMQIMQAYIIVLIYFFIVSQEYKNYYSNILTNASELRHLKGVNAFKCLNAEN